MTKPTKWYVRPAKTQISLGIHPVWSESSLCTQWEAKDPSFLHADSEDSDQTGQMPRLIWVFAGRTVISLVLSWGGSYQVEDCHSGWFAESLINEPWHDKTNNVAVHPAKTQISLGIRPVWAESSLSTQCVAKDPSFIHADSEDSDRTGRMPRLIWVFAGRSCHFVGFVMRHLGCVTCAYKIGYLLQVQLI